MDTRTLEYFMVIAGQRNMTRAAGLLHISQPSLSRQMRQLEEEVGKTLFIRSNKSMELTEDGKVFRQYAENILTIYRRAIADTEVKTLSGDIAIAGASIRHLTGFAGMIDDFLEEYPGVRVHFAAMDSDHVRDSIDQGLTDLGIVYSENGLDRYNIIDTGISVRWGSLMSASHPLASHTVITSADLKGQSLMIPFRTDYQNALEGWLGKYRRNVHICGNFDMGSNAAELSRQGRIITIAMGASMYEPLNMKFIPLDPPMMARAYLIYGKKPVYPSVFKEFLRKTNNLFSESQTI